VAGALAPLGAKASVHDDIDVLAEAIVTEARSGDHVLVMSNGGFGGIHGELLARLRGRVMNAPTIVYLHGFNSSPRSVKGSALARAAAALNEPPRFHVPDLAHRPAQAIHEVCAWIESSAANAGNLAFIGSSLGGFYATWLAERYGARAVV